MESTNLDQLEAIRVRAEAATPGPWRRGKYGGIYTQQGGVTKPAIGMLSYKDGGFRPNAKNNENFIAHARSDIPYLLSIIGTLRREVIEECAKTAESFEMPHNVLGPQQIASRIRALKTEVGG